MRMPGCTQFLINGLERSSKIVEIISFMCWKTHYLQFVHTYLQMLPSSVYGALRV